MFKQRLANLFNDNRDSHKKEEKEPKPANGVAQATLQTPTASPSPRPKTHDVVLVERDAEIAKLRSMWEAACKGRGRVVLIAGEAGFGKSSLADWVLQTLTPEKTGKPAYKVAKAACSAQSGQDEPFWPFADCMSQLVAAPTNKKVTEDVLDSILEFAPSWVSVIPVAGPVVEAGLKTAQVVRNRTKTSDAPNPDKLLREYVGALRTVAAKQPVLLFIDDLHWSDAMSIRLLSHLSRSVQDMRCLIIGSYRPSDIAVEGHPLQSLIAELTRYDGDGQMTLQPLTREGVQALLSKLYPGHRFPETLVTYLTDTTGGAPLFVVESLRLMQKRGELAQDEKDGRWQLTRELNEGDLPDSVEAIINKRLERLPNELRDILAHAAVEGSSFDAAVLAYVLDKDELKVMQLLQPAEEEHDIIDYVGDVDLGKDVTVRYAFSSNLFQRQLLETLRGKKRLNAFRRSAEGLDQLWPDDSEDLAPKLAHLYEHGKVFDAASRYLCTAGHYARQAGNIARAIELYERGEKSLNRYLPETAEDELLTHKQRQNMDEALSYLYEVDSNYEKSELRTRRALARGLDALGWRRYASLQMRLASLAARAGRLREALSSLLALLGLLDNTHPEDEHSYEAFQLRAEIAKMQTLLGRSDEAVTEAEAALRELETIPDLEWKRAARARLNTALTLAYHEGGEYRRAVALSEETLAVLQELNMVSTFAALLANLVDLYIEVGDYEKAESHINMMKEAARDTSNESLLATAHLESGLSRLWQDKDEDALREFDEAEKWATHVKTFDNRPKLLALRALALVDLNRLDEAQAATNEADELARDAGSPEWTAYAFMAQARLAEARGDCASALQQGSEAADIFKKEGTRFDEAMALRVVARAHGKLGQAAEAAKAYERAIGELKLIGNAGMAARVAGEARVPLPGD
jgi:predicted ATPase